MYVNINNINEELNFIFSFFSTKYFITDNNIKYFTKSDSKFITWDNYRPGIYKEAYIYEFADLKKDFQYSFLLNDGSFFQFYYDIKEDILQKMKLAYYPIPKESRKLTEEFIENLIISGDYDEEIEEDLYNLLESHDYTSISNSSCIRVDYDKNVESHSKCELQIASINKLRIPLNHLISPIVFFDLMCKNLYSKLYLTSINTIYMQKLTNSLKKSEEVECIKDNIFAKLNI
ncbi:DUF2290 domain-containing protein [Aliarcobacter butzleri]|uniref:DUF2290 domain-containing protein n=1 Tax=Aliarcobacter butzleri TaxID=28197 RepID=UPI0021B1949D|nr:DUF2290 domain-containing protein [Aliarcobacter butzleri]MCT7604555.1 DUF2290 domain-containing protein [Aliarcobacter butzleri]